MTGPIKVSIRVDEQAGGSLYRWLALDPDVQQAATVTLAPAPPGAGELGSALDVIDVLLSNGIAVGSLVVAIASWRQSRPRPPKTRIEGDDFSLEIEDASPETLQRLVEALRDRPAIEPAEGHDDGPV